MRVHSALSAAGRYTGAKMLGKLRRVVLWQYPETTSVDTLLGHRRWAVRIVHAWTGAGVLMTSSLAELFLSGPGLPRTVSMIAMLVSSALALLLTFPAVLAMPWANDIERALWARGYELPTVKPLERRAAGSAMKTCFWAVAAVVMANVVRKV